MGVGERRRACTRARPCYHMEVTYTRPGKGRPKRSGPNHTLSLISYSDSREREREWLTSMWAPLHRSRVTTTSSRKSTFLFATRACVCALVNVYFFSAYSSGRDANTVLNICNF